MIDWFLNLPVENKVPILVAVIALFGVIVTIVCNVYLGKKNIKANVISKARIEWIQNVRGYLTRYISLSSSMNSYYFVWLRDNNKPEDFKKISEVIIEFQNLKNLLILNLGPDDEDIDYNNKQFIELIVELHDITDTRIAEVVPDKINENYSKKMEELIFFARIYFKNEWNKAKKGK